MSIENLAANLRVLCSYTPSISDTCRRLGINRAQFYRYLNGKNTPSLRTLRRVCDHFGIEDDEILQDEESFRRMIALRKPSKGRLDPLGDYMIGLNEINPRSTKDLRPYLGFYYSYFCPVEFPGKANRSLVKVFERNGFVYNKTIENYASIHRRRNKILRYRGIVYHSGDRIFITERESSSGKMMWQTTLYPAQGDQFNMLTGLTMGISSGANREIACYRAVMEFLGETIPMRKALHDCGLFDIDSAEIPDDIRSKIRNTIGAEENGFVSRPWE
jgi:transcriptional regulator with XRE-family HTH domain